MSTSATIERAVLSAVPRSRPAGDQLDPSQHGGTIRLLLTIGSLEVGGSEKQLTDLVVNLPRDRVDPVLLTTGRSGVRSRLEREVLGAGVPVIRSAIPAGGRARRGVRLLREINAAIDAVTPDVVYAWLDETATLVAPLCRMRGIPCLIARRNVSGSQMERRHPGWGTLFRRAERLADLVTANSAAVAAASVARGHDPGRIRLVRNGHAQLLPLPAPEGPPVVFGYVAHLRAEKGHHRLLDVLDRLPPGGWRVDLAGDGPLRGEILERIGEAGLEDRVRLLGPVEDVREFWRSRHVALLLSDTEGSPNALLEAALAGRPVIATAVGGTPELVGGAGILVAPEDTAQTVAAIHMLIRDPVRRERLGEAIYEHARANHSITQMLDGHLRALQEVHARFSCSSGAGSLGAADRPPPGPVAPIPSGTGPGA